MRFLPLPKNDYPHKYRHAFLFSAWRNRLRGVLVFLLFVFLPHQLQAEDNSEEKNSSLKIKSAVLAPSANCTLGSVTEEEDQKRTEIGVGEEVELELIGKRIKDVTTVSWSISSGQEFAKIRNEKSDSKVVTLIASGNAKSSGTVKVEAKTNLDEEDGTSPSISFTVVVPIKIEAKHSGRRIPNFPEDGDTATAGASTLLTLTFSPLSVNFQRMYFKEKAADAPGDTPGWIPPHSPAQASNSPNGKNEFSYDQIGFCKDRILMQDHFSQNNILKAQYKCAWYTYYDDYCCLIGGKPYLQTTEIATDGIREKDNTHEIKVSVSKFGCTVTRSTAGTAKHENNQLP